jgi:MATE family multidrug resistance protein
MLRGLHDTRWPLLFALFGYWIVGSGSAPGSPSAAMARSRNLGRLASGLAAVAVLMLAAGSRGSGSA